MTSYSDVSTPPLQPPLLADERRLELAPWAAEFLAGAAGGTLECLSGHPFDTVKVRQQTGGAGSSAGILSTFRSVIRKEGAGGLYRGVQSPLAGLVFINAVMFSTYTSALRFLTTSDDGVELCSAPATHVPLHLHFAAGAVSGLATSLVEAPVDLLKCQLQRQHLLPPERRITSLLGAAVHVYQRTGVAGFSRGLTATLLRNVPGQGCHFAAYYGAMRVLGKGQREEDISPLRCLLAGSIAGLGLWAVTYPADVIKSRMQSDALGYKQRLYHSVRGCAADILREQGVGGFYRGFVTCCARSVPATAACFLGYELAIRGLA